MARIFPRGKILWIQYSVNGERFRESLGLQDSRENRKIARKILKQKEAEILTGIHPIIKKVHRKYLSNSFEEFLSTKRNRSERTIEMYNYVHDKFLNFAGDIELHKVDEDLVDEFEKFIKFKKVKKKNEEGKVVEEVREKSKNTIEIIFRHLRIIFEYYKKQRYVTTNPFPIKDKTPKRINVIPDYELDEILTKLRVHDRDQYKAIKLLVMTGLRAGELIRLKHEDFDLKRKILYVTNTKGRRVDKIPLHPELELFYEINYSKAERSGKVVPYQRIDSLKFFRRFLEREGYPHYSIHELRKTFLTRLANDGVDIYYVQKIARHKDIKTTERYYLNVDLKRMGEEISRVIKGTEKDTTKRNRLKLVKKRK
ncbi:MAG: tyrosine-type recombinase/integrase [Melioribacteraceae bacterium]|nr:MAG: tyrosine-type recombinase/integrase [Melioribacteraceae bacterium]